MPTIMQKLEQNWAREGHSGMPVFNEIEDLNEYHPVEGEEAEFKVRTEAIEEQGGTGFIKMTLSGQWNQKAKSLIGSLEFRLRENTEDDSKSYLFATAEPGNNNNGWELLCFVEDRLDANDTFQGTMTWRSYDTGEVKMTKWPWIKGPMNI